MSLYWSIICFMPLLKTNTRSTSVSYIKGITENRRDNAMSITLQKQMYGCRCLTTNLEGKLWQIKLSLNIVFYNCGQFHNRSNYVINLDLVYALFYIFFIRVFLGTCMLSHNWSCQTYGTIARTYTLSTCLRIEGDISLSWKDRFSKIQKCMYVVMSEVKKQFSLLETKSWRRIC